MDICRGTRSCWNRNWKTHSAPPIAKSICTYYPTGSNYAMSSRNLEMSAWKPVYSPTTTSAALWSRREPWVSTHRWKWCSGLSEKKLRAKGVMILKRPHWDPSTFKYDKLWTHVLNKYVTADAITHLDLDGARMVPGVSPYSIPAGVPLSQMPVVVNLLAIPSEETLPPVQAVEAIPISKAENTMDTKMENMMKAFEAWTFRMSKANEPRYGGYQSARGCAI